VGGHYAAGGIDWAGAGDDDEQEEGSEAGGARIGDAHAAWQLGQPAPPTAVAGALGAEAAAVQTPLAGAGRRRAKAFTTEAGSARPEAAPAAAAEAAAAREEEQQREVLPLMPDGQASPVTPITAKLARPIQHDQQLQLPACQVVCRSTLQELVGRLPPRNISLDTEEGAEGGGQASVGTSCCCSCFSAVSTCAAAAGSTALPPPPACCSANRVGASPLLHPISLRPCRC
jgi:hypothetical protein